MVRTNGLVYAVTVTDPNDDSTWESVDLLAEEYDYDTGRVTLSGRCKLAKLDVDDQVIIAEDDLSTAEGWTVAELLTEIAGHVGLTVTGAPTRVVPQFHLVGNPLEMFGDLLEPTHGFRMGSGNQIVVFELASRSTAGSLKDDADLELVKFKRSSAIRNRATVERLVPDPGPVVLYSGTASQEPGGSPVTGTQGPFEFSSPSRYWWFTKKNGYRGEINSVSPKDEVGAPVGSQPLTATAYQNSEPAAGCSFNYELGEDAAAQGPFVPNWEIEVTGYPADVLPPPTEDFSATKSAGAGDKPYPEPFSCISINTQEEAETAAQALVDKGIREGQMLNLGTRVRPDKIFAANSSIDLEDFLSGLNLDVVLETPTLAWGEKDTGTLGYECTFAEED